MNENLIPRARLYASARQLETAETLGSGKDGIVLVAGDKQKIGSHVGDPSGYVIC